ncbi:hypothetical protein PM082_024107 [Marasmius tenuissimus]|nr:hypothetical protein PM082_024107 [Marasmius tenuissimus]
MILSLKPSCSASVAALLTSTINIGVLTLQHGRQLGWVCLGSCGTDVILNAIAIFWVTNTNSETTALLDEYPSAARGESQNLGRRGGRPGLILQSHPGPDAFGMQATSHKSLCSGKQRISRMSNDSHMLQVVVTTHTSTETDPDASSGHVSSRIKDTSSSARDI